MRFPLAVLTLLGVVAVLAGSGAGSSTGVPRATAPVLLAHDTTSFTRAEAQREPSLWASRRPTAGRTQLFNDTILHSATVLNPSADISKTQYVVGTQGNYDVLSRTFTSTGRLLARVAATSFWANVGGGAADLCATDPQGEPSVAYDWNADRWVVSEAAYTLSGTKPTGPYVQCVAVSTSSDATGTWNRYVFQVSTSLYPDRATIGVWSDAYYLSFNQHDADGDWAGAGALAVERSKMLTGASAQARYFDLSTVTPGLGGLLPADINGPNQPANGAPELYVQMHDDPSNINDRVEVWSFHVDWTAPVTGSTFQPLVNLGVDSGGFTYDSLFSCTDPSDPFATWSNCVFEEPPPLQSTPLPLDPMAMAYGDSADRLPQLGGRVEWGRSSGGNETMSFAAAMNTGSNVAGVAWFKLSNTGSGWGIGSRGVYAPDSSDRYLPSAGFDNSGHVALGFVDVDGLHYPSTVVADAQGAETAVDTATVPFTDKEFGGGTSLSLDPVDDCTFWFAGPLPWNQTTTTSIGTYSVGGCTPAAPQVPLLTADPSWTAPLVREGLTITGNAGTFSNAAGTSYQWRRCDTRGLNCVDIAGETSPTHLMTATDANGTHTLRFEEIGTNATGSSVAVSTATTLVQSIPPVNVTLPVISGTAQVGDDLTTSDGTWTSSSPLSYTYRWRRCTATCVNIAGANSSTYTLTSADAGATVDVVVSAVNTGGGTDANAGATATVVAAATAGGSGGGGGGTSGGGGGTGGSLDLQLTGTQSPVAPKAGDTVTYSLTATDLTTSQLAQNVNVAVVLPSGETYVSSQVDRGGGCRQTDASHLTCNLDFLSAQAPSGHIVLVVHVTEDGQHTLTATLSAAQSESSLANNTVTLSDGSATTTSSTTSTGTPVGLNGSGSTKTTKTADKKAPTAHALGSAGRRNATAKLRFRIYDDSGVAKAVATIRRNGKSVGSAKTGFGTVAYGSVYFVGWHVPKKAPKGAYSFCVVAYDRASHQSARTCAPLALR